MLLKHSGIYLLARGLPAAINLIALMLYTRLLPPETYGECALVLAGAGLTGVVLFQWLELGLLRFLPSYQNREGIFLSTLMAGFVALLLVTGLGAGTALLFIPDPHVRQLILLGLALLWAQTFFSLNQQLLRSRLQPLQYGYLTMAKASLSLVLATALILAGHGTFGLIIGLSCGALLPTLYCARANLGRLHLGEIKPALLYELLHYGAPLTATVALGAVVSNSDRFILAWFFGNAAAGTYAAAYDLTRNSLGVIMMIINLAGYPLVVKTLEQRGSQAARRQLHRVAISLLGLALPAAVGIAMLSGGIAEVFLGAPFRPAAHLLIPWIAVAVLLAGIRSYYFDFSFQLGRKTGGQAWIMLLAAGVNLALNFLLIPGQGLLGAAYATLAAYGVALICSWSFGRRIFPLPLPWKEGLGIALATAGMVLALKIPLPPMELLWGLLLQICWGGAIYLGLVWLFNIGEVRNRFHEFKGFSH